MTNNPPIRIQRKRTKGWRMPANTKCVNRGTKWGNPFIVGKHGGRDACIDGFKAVCRGVITISRNAPSIFDQQKLRSAVQSDLHEIRGLNLACFCKEGEACHGDVLLKIANK